MIKISAYIQQSSVAKDAEQGMNVALAGEVQTCAYVTTRRHHTTRVPEHQGTGNDTKLISQHGTRNTHKHTLYILYVRSLCTCKHVCVCFVWLVFSQGVQLVNGLVLMGPLQVQLDFLHQRNTVSLSDVQFLCFADAILLIWMIWKKKKKKKAKWTFIHFYLIDLSMVMRRWSLISAYFGQKARETRWSLSCITGWTQITSNTFMHEDLNIKFHGFSCDLCCSTSQINLLFSFNWQSVSLLMLFFMAYFIVYFSISLLSHTTIFGATLKSCHRAQ